MNTPDTQLLTLAFSLEELCFLLLALKLPALPGLEDGLPSALEGEIGNARLNTALNGLQARGFVQPLRAPDGTLNELVVDQTLNAILDSAAHPVVTLSLISAEPGSASLPIYYLIGKHLIIEYMSTAPGQFRLTALGDLTTLGGMLITRMQVGFHADPVTPTRYDVPAAWLDLLRDANAVPASNVPSATADALAAIFAETVRSHLLLGSRPIDSERVLSAQCSLLDTPDALWLITPQAEGVVRLEAITAVQWVEQMTQLFGTLMPELFQPA